MPQFQTLKLVPDMQGRRYGLLELGTTNVEVVRREHNRLIATCAKLLGVAPDDLTTEEVEALADRQLVPLDPKQ